MCEGSKNESGFKVYQDMDGSVAMPTRTSLARSHQQTAVLKAIVEVYSIRKAARFAQVHRSTVYRWLVTDPVFKARYDAAIASHFALVRAQVEAAQAAARERREKRLEELRPAARERAAHARACYARKRAQEWW